MTNPENNETYITGIGWDSGHTIVKNTGFIGEVNGVFYVRCSSSYYVMPLESHSREACVIEVHRRVFSAEDRMLLEDFESMATNPDEITFSQEISDDGSTEIVYIQAKYIPAFLRFNSLDWHTTPVSGWTYFRANGRVEFAELSNYGGGMSTFQFRGWAPELPGGVRYHHAKPDEVMRMERRLNIEVAIPY